MPSTSKLAASSLLATAMSALACLTPIDDTCTDDRDCFRDQRCQERRCVRGQRPTQDLDMTPAPDASPDVAPDLTPPKTPVCALTGAVASCQDPDPLGQTRAQARVLNPNLRAGCSNDGSLVTYRTPSPLRSRRCPGDEDYVSVQIAECDRYDVIVQATLRPEPLCDEGLATLRAWINGKELICGQDATLRCQTLPNGALRRAVVVPARGSRSVGTVYFATDGAGRSDVLYDYVLDVEVSHEPTP